MNYIDAYKKYWDRVLVLIASNKIKLSIAISMMIILISFPINWILGFVQTILLLLLLFIINQTIVQKEVVVHEVKDEKILVDAKNAQEDALYQSPIAALLYDNNQNVRWINPAFQHIFGQVQLLGKPLEELDENLTKFINNNEPTKKWQEIDINNKKFKINHQKDRKVIYLIDFSKEYEILKLKKYEQLVFGYIFLDDYADVIQSLDDQEELQFDSMLVTDLTNWATQQGIYIKRIENERFLLLMNKENLDQLEETKFKELEVIKNQDYFINMPIGISIGLGYSDEPAYQIEELSQIALSNLELALGRGGNQVVVRSLDDKARFYGGKVNPTEKRTNTRSKQVYRALKIATENASQVFIVGHKYPDLDAIASAIGIYKLIHQLNKNVKIILDESELNPDVLMLLDNPQIHQEAQNIFIDVATTKTMIDSNSIIIMVDHHRPSLSQAEEILTLDQYDVIVIDHHRRSEEFPSKSVLTFIEPYASSTAELITEFYIAMRDTQLMLSKFEATALLGGIIIDTNNFTQRTGARTFDAASYLKSRGASTLEIQRFLKEDFERIQEKNTIISTGQYFLDHVIIAHGHLTHTQDNIVASQAADELLKLKNIEASFVVYNRQDNKIGISARSLGNINVQTIMEKLGGGGHLSNAATQLDDISILDAIEQLKQILTYTFEKE